MRNPAAAFTIALVLTGCSALLGDFDVAPDAAISPQSEGGAEQDGASAAAPAEGGDAAPWGGAGGASGGGADDARAPSDAGDAAIDAGCAVGATSCDGAVPRTCDANHAWHDGPITAGKCGAVCSAGELRCDLSSFTGETCGAFGAWISNGSSVACNCYVEGRFTKLSDTLVKDSTTGYVWDFAVRAADTWANASSACNAAGMRLPNESELGSSLVDTHADAGPKCPGPPGVPFDQSALPTQASDFPIWTSQPESGFMGYAMVLQFLSSSSGSAWTWTDAAQSEHHHYRCVK